MISASGLKQAVCLCKLWKWFYNQYITRSYLTITCALTWMQGWMHVLCNEAFVWFDYGWNARLQWDDIIVLCHSTVWVCLPLSICVWAAAYSWSSFRSIRQSLPVIAWALQLYVLSRSLLLSLSQLLENSMRTSLLSLSLWSNANRSDEGASCWFLWLILHLLLDVLRDILAQFPHWTREERNSARTCNNHTVSSMRIWC